MNHYQRHFNCGVCGEKIIIDIRNVGVSHDTILAATHEKCAEKVGGNIIKDGEPEELTFSTPEK